MHDLQMIEKKNKWFVKEIMRQNGLKRVANQSMHGWAQGKRDTKTPLNCRRH